MHLTARTPAMATMTVLTLHDLTGGRFVKSYKKKRGSTAPFFACFLLDYGMP